MTITANTFSKKGYIPLACSRHAGVAWQGESLGEFWMWNRQFTEYEGGIKRIQTVKVTELKEAALRYWRDKWVPVRPIDEALLRRMENTLRRHRGLMAQGVTFPDGQFLSMPEPIPQENLGPELRKMLGLPEDKSAAGLKRKGEPSGKVLEGYKKSKGV